jgi:Flp pilus assembly protein TadG
MKIHCSFKALGINSSENNPDLSPDSKGRSFVSRLRNLLGSSSEGNAIVETAVMLPVLMIMVTGISSFSLALYQKVQLCEAVSNAGHRLVSDLGDTDPCATATQALYAAAPGLNSANITLTYTINAKNYGTGVTSCPGPSGGANTDMTAGQSVQVQASYPCIVGIYGIGTASCNIATQITEMVQ